MRGSGTAGKTPRSGSQKELRLPSSDCRRSLCQARWKEQDRERLANLKPVIGMQPALLGQDGSPSASTGLCSAHQSTCFFGDQNWGQARGRMCIQVVTLPRLHLPASDLGLAVVRQTGTYTESHELGQHGQTCAGHLQRDKSGLGTQLLSQHLVSSSRRRL